MNSKFENKIFTYIQKKILVYPLNLNRKNHSLPQLESFNYKDGWMFSKSIQMKIFPSHVFIMELASIYEWSITKYVIVGSIALDIRGGMKVTKQMKVVGTQ